MVQECMDTFYAVADSCFGDLLRDHKQEEEASEPAMPVKSHQDKHERIWTLPAA